MFEISIQNEVFLPALMAISGAVDKKQSLPILGNFLLNLSDGNLKITATDLEIEMTASMPYSSEDHFQTTIPARKLMDILRSLDTNDLRFRFEDNKATVLSGRSKFRLSTLSAKAFPESEQKSVLQTFTVARETLLLLLQSTQFAMAQQDVRIFLNALYLEFMHNTLFAVATDGHRMAIRNQAIEHDGEPLQALLPRRAVQEMIRLLASIDEDHIEISFGKGFFRMNSAMVSFMTRLTEAKFPPFRKAIPQRHERFITVEKDILKRALHRMAILAHEKSRAVVLDVNQGELALIARNQEQEEAQEIIEATLDCSDISVGLNANYLLDVLGILPEGPVKLSLSNPDSSILIESPIDSQYQYVLMPMKI